MKTKEFAEKHLGKRIHNTRPEAKSQYGVISGYTLDNESIIYEPEEKEIGYRAANPKINNTHKFLRTIKKYMVFGITRVGKDIVILESPDDCDDCGARGVDPCKEWCPNKVQVN